MTFSERLKELRKKYNLNQAEIANILNVGQRQISYYENDRDIPPLPALIRLSNYFGVSLDYLSGRSDNPRYEDFIENAEIELFNEAEEFIKIGINAEVNSDNEFIGLVGNFMKNFYNSRKPKYTSPLARLRLIFATREEANQRLSHPKTIKVHLITPEPFRRATLLNPKEFLKERGILPQEVQDIKPLKAGEKTRVQLLTEELDKLEEEYIRSNPLPKTDK